MKAFGGRKVPNMAYLNGNLIVAIDLETTGLEPGYHEIIQVAVVPLDAQYQQSAEAFYTFVRPAYPERQCVEARDRHHLPMEELLAAPDSERVQDLLMEWVDQLRRGMPAHCRLIPLAHNWVFEAGFLRTWLGTDLMNKVFHFQARDGMLFANSLNDREVLAGRPALFPRVGLDALGAQLGVINTRPHDALADCIAEAEVYRTLLQL
jgi:DNA polymerase-3 subunit epsilon